MKARQRKKNAKKEDQQRSVNITNAKCPDCGSHRGMIGIFVDEDRTKATFLYCEMCGYSYTLGDNTKT
jgi:transcription elongation factor Elf1